MTEEMNPWVRFIIKAEVEGYEVDIYVYDTDIERVVVDTDAEPLPFEPGVLQWAISGIKEHGATPIKRSSGGGFGGGTQRQWGAKKSSWECPVHGDKNVRDSYFDKSRKECNYREEAIEEEPQPDWAKDKDGMPTFVKSDNKYYWYCKYSEPKKK